MKIALGQINTTVGDLDGNLRLMVRFARDANCRGADLVVFPELSLNGYPPRDLVEKPGFLRSTEEGLHQLAAETKDLGLAIICGYAGRAPKDAGKSAANCAAVIEQGEIIFPADQDAAAYLRCVRRSQKFCRRRIAGGVHHQGCAGGAGHL